MSEEPTVEQLIAAAHARAGNEDELALLDAVIAVTQDLTGHADEAVDQVVRQVRAAGHSWTVIGERLGVSRQAARQRYVDRVDRIQEAPTAGGLIRGRDLRSGLSAALTAAEADGLAEAGTEHLLLGLLTDGVAAATLEHLGITRDKIREASRRPDDASSRCSFCGHAGSDERRLVSGPDVWICADCVVLCGEILAQPAGAGSK
ncbi:MULTISPECIES: ClpX C4-type zinc finger protein [Streptomyces]|uniref:ClpX C4-type zinc finger protein n=1 Tax=Streptomyces TaxID=1883 RepID=UPI001C30FF39|nr:ClpX C4-type zinc finger protein [Streptomyces sp. GbtcB7]